MAPFALVVLMEGISLVPLALSLGLLASLMNDLFYYPVGDLVFGMKVNVLAWWQGQLGFDGLHSIFTFQGGMFSFDVTSMIMGASVYLRIFIVVFLMYRWSHRTQSGESSLR
jgi:hypothetical protein